MSLIPFRSNLATKQAYDPLRDFRSEFDRLFDDFFTHMPATMPDATRFADVRLEVSETDKEVRVRAELPGVEEKDIDIELNRDVLTLRGEKRFESEEKERNYHLVERSYGTFTRSIRLPFEASSDSVKATFKNGLLNVTVPKPEQKKEHATKIALQRE